MLEEPIRDIEVPIDAKEQSQHDTGKTLVRTVTHYNLYITLGQQLTEVEKLKILDTKNQYIVTLLEKIQGIACNTRRHFLMGPWQYNLSTSATYLAVYSFYIYYVII